MHVRSLSRAPKRVVASGATLAVAVLGLYLLGLAAVAEPAGASSTTAAGAFSLAMAVGLWRR